MTRIILLERLRAFTEEATADLIMPTRMQKGDTEQGYRPADVYLMRLPDGTSATKKAPYVLHQVITGMDQQPQGQRVTSSAKVRSICCVYNDDEQEGGLMLLNLMERHPRGAAAGRSSSESSSPLIWKQGLRCWSIPMTPPPISWEK